MSDGFSLIVSRGLMRTWIRGMTPRSWSSTMQVTPRTIELTVKAKEASSAVDGKHVEGLYAKAVRVFYTSKRVF